MFVFLRNLTGSSGSYPKVFNLDCSHMLNCLVEQPPLEWVGFVSQHITSTLTAAQERSSNDNAKNKSSFSFSFISQQKVSLEKCVGFSWELNYHDAFTLAELHADCHMNLSNYFPSDLKSQVRRVSKTKKVPPSVSRPFQVSSKQVIGFI